MISIQSFFNCHKQSTLSSPKVCQNSVSRCTRCCGSFKLFATNQDILESSRLLAASRADETLNLPQPLIYDQFASPLSLDTSCSPLPKRSPNQKKLDVLIARFLDEQLLEAVNLVNSDRSFTKEYNQVVLLGDGLDTRPFRLPWPTGTILFCIAPGEVHERAEAVLSQSTDNNTTIKEKAHVPRGCLLRRVSHDFRKPTSFADALTRAGFQTDRLSLWALQATNCLALNDDVINSMLTDASNLAAFDSLLFGELTPRKKGDVDNMLASFGLLGSAVSYREVVDNLLEAGIPIDGVDVDDILKEEGRRVENNNNNNDDDDDVVEKQQQQQQPWMFIAQQKRLSIGEMDVYTDHVQAGEEADEDFSGNFS